MSCIAIYNPYAGRGKAARHWPGIERELRTRLPDLEVRQTQSAGHEAELARAAIADGADHLIAIGGDGTVNGVLAGIMAAGAGDRVALSAIPAGTANELCRYLGVHDDVSGAIAAIGSGRQRRIDLLEARCTGIGGGDVLRHGLLAISWGAAAEISYRTSASRYLKALGGQFSYYAVTLLVTLTYPNRVGHLTVDEDCQQDLLHYTGMVCNTEYLGGGMRLAPGADPADGQADLLLFRDIPRKDILLQKPSWLFEGRHLEHEKVELRRGRRIAVDGLPEVLVDADGETIGRLPLSVEVLPQALTICG